LKGFSPGRWWIACGIGVKKRTKLETGKTEGEETRNNKGKRVEDFI